MSTINNINASTPTTNTSTSNTATVEPLGANQTLTQADFLKIMVAQFTAQDPLASDSDGGGGSGASDYVNQLMSMTNLTTMQTMSSQLATSTSQQALSLAEALPGSNVTVNDANGNPVTGVVSSTSVDTSTENVILTINGTQYSSANLVSINQTAAQTAAGTTTTSTSTN
jgi:flagellar hook assembly protein FlgD